LVGEDSWWTVPVASLVIVVSAILVLSCRQTDRQIDRQTDRQTYTQTRMNALLMRLSSSA